jgi:hypothetical protein
MKSHDEGPQANRLAPLPLEWMDPMSWRLPSGKALAEFALQSGFLAPLLMNGPMGDGRVKRKKTIRAEVPVNPGRFRRTAATHTRQGE